MTPDDKKDANKTIDFLDDQPGNTPKSPIKHSNIKKIPELQKAVALQDRSSERKIPLMTASGQGKIAEKILQLAYDNGIKVREDSALADMLMQFDHNSPIPSEAFEAVAQVLVHVYKANGMPNPFDARIKDDS